MVEDEGFVRRWSQRKAAARQQAREDDRQAEAERPVGEAPPPANEAPASEAPAPIDPAELPDPETLDAESDFTPFLRDGVPEALQRAALRRLWRLNPVLANLDGLVDYGEDFTDAATVIQGMQSVYQVGRGMATAFEKPADEAAGEAAGAASDAEPGDPPPAIEAGRDTPLAQEPAPTAEDADTAAPAAIPSDKPKSA